MAKDFKPTEYTLRSVKTGKTFKDEGWTLEAPEENEPTLIRAIYDKKQLMLKTIRGEFTNLPTGFPFKKH